MNPAFLLLAFAAHAEPGRLNAGATWAATPQGAHVWRGAADYGLWRHISLQGELGTLPTDDLQVGGAGGLLLDVVDGRWWRVGITAQPEVVFSVEPDVDPVGWRLGDSPLALEARTGLRVGWLAFWGLSFTARVDRVFTLTETPGWTEIGGGLAVRM